MNPTPNLPADALPAAPLPEANLPPKGSHVLVHGLGRFGGGREATRFLLRRGCQVRVCDGSSSEELLAVQAAFGKSPIDWQLGRECQNDHSWAR